MVPPATVALVWSSGSLSSTSGGGYVRPELRYYLLASMPLPADFDTKLWAAADQLWTHSALQPSEYSTPVLALIFLPYRASLRSKTNVLLAWSPRPREPQGSLRPIAYSARGF